MAPRKWDACIKAFIEVFIRRVVTKYTTATAEALDPWPNMVRSPAEHYIYTYLFYKNESNNGGIVRR